MKNLFNSLKTTVKTAVFSCLVMIGLAATTHEVKAQGTITPLMGAGTTTNNVAAASTNTYTGLRFSKPKAANASITLMCSMSNATNSTVNFVLKPEDTGTNLSTVAAQWITIPVIVQTNSRAEVYVTNFNWGAITRWELTSIGNTNGGAYVTNINVKVVALDGI